MVGAGVHYRGFVQRGSRGNGDLHLVIGSSAQVIGHYEAEVELVGYGKIRCLEGRRCAYRRGQRDRLTCRLKPGGADNTAVRVTRCAGEDHGAPRSYALVGTSRCGGRLVTQRGRRIHLNGHVIESDGAFIVRRAEAKE